MSDNQYLALELDSEGRLWLRIGNNPLCELDTSKPLRACLEEDRDHWLRQYDPRDDPVARDYAEVVERLLKKLTPNPPPPLP